MRFLTMLVLLVCVHGPGSWYFLCLLAASFGVVMTGMGRDGLNGCAEVKKRGGRVFAQHEHGCLVYGMPKAVIDAGIADRILPLGRIARGIVRHVQESRRG